MTIQESNINNSFLSMQLDSWHNFSDCINKRLIEFKYVYRGQRKANWPVLSTISREFAKRSIKGSSELIQKHLDTFRYSSRGRKGTTKMSYYDNLPEEEWWGIAQHNGLYTHLLDWTESPYVAAFFAFAVTGPDDEKYRSIWCILPNNIVRKNKQLPEGDKIAFFRPKIDDNVRLVAQAGLFTISPLNTDIKSWVIDKFPGETTAATLIQINIPNSDRELVLKSLNKMNINYASLFPDLFGATMHANLCFEIQNY